MAGSGRCSFGWTHDGCGVGLRHCTNRVTLRWHLSTCSDMVECRRGTFNVCRRRISCLSMVDESCLRERPRATYRSKVRGSRTPTFRGRTVTLRRCTALVLIWCFALFSGEALLADVHDGDASAPELQIVGGAHVGTHMSAGIALRMQKTGLTTLQSSGDDSPPPSQRAPQQPVHTQHACHCVHAHSGVDSSARAASVPQSPRTSALAPNGVLMPPSRSPEPQLRPPIA